MRVYHCPHIFPKVIILQPHKVQDSLSWGSNILQQSRICPLVIVIINYQRVVNVLLCDSMSTHSQCSAWWDTHSQPSVCGTNATTGWQPMSASCACTLTLFDCFFKHRQRHDIVNPGGGKKKKKVTQRISLCPTATITGINFYKISSVTNFVHCCINQKLDFLFIFCDDDEWLKCKQ